MTLLTWKQISQRLASIWLHTLNLLWNLSCNPSGLMICKCIFNVSKPNYVFRKVFKSSLLVHPGRMSKISFSCLFTLLDHVTKQWNVPKLNYYLNTDFYNNMLPLTTSVSKGHGAKSLQQTGRKTKNNHKKLCSLKSSMTFILMNPFITAFKMSSAVVTSLVVMTDW